MDLVPMLAVTDLKEALAVSIPIIAIVMGCGIPIVAIVADYKRKKNLFELHHKERLAAIERGMEVPPLPAGLLGGAPKLRRPPQDYARQGLVLLFLGTSLCFVFRGLLGPDKQWLGLPLVAIGLAYLCYYFALGRRESAKGETAPQTERSQSGS